MAILTTLDGSVVIHCNQLQPLPGHTPHNIYIYNYILYNYDIYIYIIIIGY